MSKKLIPLRYAIISVIDSDLDYRELDQLMNEFHKIYYESELRADTEDALLNQLMTCITNCTEGDKHIYDRIKLAIKFCIKQLRIDNLYDAILNNQNMIVNEQYDISIDIESIVIEDKKEDIIIIFDAISYKTLLLYYRVYNL